MPIFKRASSLLMSIVLFFALLVTFVTVLTIHAQPEDSGDEVTEETHVEILAQSTETASGQTLSQTVSQGSYPTQLTASTGDIAPNRYGPQRNDPAADIPRNAYSPFDEQLNREHLCPPGGCDFEPGQVLIKLAPQTTVVKEGLNRLESNDSSLNQLMSEQGILQLELLFPQTEPPRNGEMILAPDGTLMQKPDLTRWYLATLKQSEIADVYAVVENLIGNAAIAYAEPNYLRQPTGMLEAQIAAENKTALATIPGPGSDPLFNQQWHLQAANVTTAWQWLADNGYEPGGSRDIIVAVIDTGVDYTHPDLASNMWINAVELNGTSGIDDDGNGYIDDIHGVTVVSNQHNGDPQDDHGHGTHVAGIIAAQANNNLGGVGVAYNTQIMAIKAAQYSGVLSSADSAEGVYYAVAHGADVINMSFGGYTRSQVEEDALAVAFGQTVLVAAAGNDKRRNSPCGYSFYPAAYNWVLGVMASTQSGGFALFSNLDCIPHDIHEYELRAPGASIWSTLPLEEYASWSGTSMAAPVVSGIAALARTRWDNKDIYSSRFIMGQIASNTSGEIGGVADAYAALTEAPQPELAYLQHWLFDTPDINLINDNDGIVDAGETVDLAIVIRNHWGRAEPVTVTLEAWADGAFQPDPYVTMITDTVNYGAVGSFNWKDNGLLYENDIIVGVDAPFRFITDPNTPNDHLIPFRLTITTRNGYDPDDPTEYSSVSRFFLLVQRGQELPQVISEDMTLTNQHYWLVPHPTLIEAGVTVTVTEGAQIQFWSTDPSGPYVVDNTPYLQVEGNLRVMGSPGDPVELFPGLLYQGHPIYIYQVGSGSVELQYARLMNPRIGQTWGVSNAKMLDSIDHSYFSQNLPNCIYPPTGGFGWSGGGCSAPNPVIGATSISYSIFRDLGWWNGSSERLLHVPIKTPVTNFQTNLYDSTPVRTVNPLTIGENNVFLNGYKLPGYEGYLWTSQLGGSGGGSIGYGCIACDASVGRANNTFRNNAFLNAWWAPARWMNIQEPTNRDWSYYVTDNYWSTTSPTLLDTLIHDYNDDFNLARQVYQPILTEPPATAYPFVVDLLISTADQVGSSGLHGPVPIVGAEQVTFTVTFNRDMDMAIPPRVSFGPDIPYTDYTIPGNWVDSRTWQGTFNVTPITGDGYQLFRIAGAVAADDPWLVTGNDTARFRFEVSTSGSASMNLQANGGEGYVDLMWTQTDFDLLAGFNLYRATSVGGSYTRINSAIIPPDQREYRDTNVQPGQPYYYKFTVVQTSMDESDFSNIVTGTPIDTILPVISHTPLTSATPGLPLTIRADVTDNVTVQSVQLFYRAIGSSNYASRNMILTTDNRYASTLEGSLVSSPGVEYYIQASDGISIVRQGQPSNPYQITVDNRPVVTSVNPNRGPASGGITVTIAGSLFQDGATVYFGNTAASNVSVLNSNQITAVTPPHFPTQIDVTVTNPGDQSGTLLRGFTYESTASQLSLPDTGGGQLDIVQIPINAANVQGLAAADIRITFDPAVLTAQDVNTGSLTPGWSLATNTSTPGQIILSMASPGGTVSGSGTLALIGFQVLGAPGSSSVLQFGTVSLNDGAIPTETADGSFAVDEVFSVSGMVHFWQNSAAVPGAILHMEGDRVYSGLSQSDGSYIVSGAQTDDYILTPSKSDDVNGISAYDASLVLQHAAELITLTGDQAMAADVNRSTAVTAMDAYYILQKAAGLLELPFPGAGTTWLFSPTNRSYSNLSADQTGQDYTAILLGDPSGNWAPVAALEGKVRALQLITATASLPQLNILPGQQMTFPLTLTLPEDSLYAVDLTLEFDPTVVTVTQVTNGMLAMGWSIASNLTEPGVVRVAMAGATSITGNGDLLLFTLQAVGVTGQESPLTLTRTELNEGGIPVTKQDGYVRIAHPVIADFAALPISGPAPLAVVFTNTSTGDFSTSLWDFGDGQTSTAQNPTHLFATPGIYTVTLAISGVGGQNTLVRPNYVSANVLNISGSVFYWSGAEPVNNTTLTLEGSSVYSTTSATNGIYLLDGLLADNYNLSPSKTDETQGISAYDASLVLQHAAGVITLGGHAATAADTNRSGSISSLDASYILQKAVSSIELPFPGADRIWDFDPQNRTYTNLSTTLTSQNFTALLLGDPSGNWEQTGTMSSNLLKSPTTLSLQEVDVQPGEQVTVSLMTSSPAGPMNSLDVEITYDSTVVSAIGVTNGALTSDWLLADNLSTPGVIRIAIAGATSLDTDGELIQITFQAVGELGMETALTFGLSHLNEGALPTQLQNGLLRITDQTDDFRIYLPMIMSNSFGQKMLMAGPYNEPLGYTWVSPISDFVGEVIKVQPASQMAIYVCPQAGHPSARRQFVGC